MKTKNLLTLIVIAVVLGAWAYMTDRDRAQTPPAAVGKAVLPDLPLNDIQKIAVITAGSTTVVARADDRWVAPGKFGYPADFNKIKEALLKVADLKVGQVARLNDAQKDELKLRSPIGAAADAANAGTLVRFLGAGDKVLGSLLIGSARERKPPQQEGQMPYYGGYPDGQYVSIDDGKTAFLVKEDVSDFAGDAKSWLDMELTSVTGSDIESISITDTNGATVDLLRTDGKLVVQGLAADEETDTSNIYGVESGLSYLRFDDLADPALTDEEVGFNTPATFVAVTKDGVRYTALIGGSPEGRSERTFRLSAGVIEQTEVDTAKEGEDAEAAEAAREKEVADRAAKVRDLNDKVGKWTYLVPAYKASSLIKTRSELVKQKESTAEASDDETAGEAKEAGEAGEAAATATATDVTETAPQMPVDEKGAPAPVTEEPAGAMPAETPATTEPPTPAEPTVEAPAPAPESAPANVEAPAAATEAAAPDPAATAVEAVTAEPVATEAEPDVKPENK